MKVKFGDVVWYAKYNKHNNLIRGYPKKAIVLDDCTYSDASRIILEQYKAEIVVYNYELYKKKSKVPKRLD